jgi:hypothetical protein
LPQWINISHAVQESHKPRTWKTLKKRRRKERGEALEEPQTDEPKDKLRKSGGWLTNIIPLPDDPEAYAEDDSVKFHKPMEVSEELLNPLS